MDLIASVNAGWCQLAFTNPHLLSLYLEDSAVSTYGCSETLLSKLQVPRAPHSNSSVRYDKDHLGG